MTRGTTPQITYRIKNGIDFGDLEEVWVTLKGERKELTKKGTDLIFDTDKKEITINLTQEETLAFQEGEVETQIRFRFYDGYTTATPVKAIEMKRILKGGVIGG